MLPDNPTTLLAQEYMVNGEFDPAVTILARERGFLTMLESDPIFGFNLNRNRILMSKGMRESHAPMCGTRDIFDGDTWWYRLIQARVAMGSPSIYPVAEILSFCILCC